MFVRLFLFACLSAYLFACLFVVGVFKGKAKSKVMLQLMHSMCKSYSKTVFYFIHASSVLRKKAN